MIVFRLRTTLPTPLVNRFSELKAAGIMKLTINQCYYAAPTPVIIA